jgi:hypothetical protein
MDSFSSVLFLGLLFLPTLWFGFRFHIDFFACDRSTLTVGRIVPLACFVLYGVFVLVHGVEGAMLALGETGLRRGGWTFILPGIGFALTAFPYQAAEMISDVRRRISSGSAYYLGWVGWGILFLVGLRHFVALTA